jgi:hypothetical protein
MAAPQPRDPRAEAASAIGDASFDPRVLEPSPPAVAVEPFADDPASPAGGRPGARVVTPVPGGDLTWAELLEERPDLVPFASSRRLAAWPRLPELPKDFEAARLGLHSLAFYVMAPARRQVNGHIGLRWTLGGFGTPFFGDDVQIRVEGMHLVVQTRQGVRFDALSTLRRAGQLVGLVPRGRDKGDFDAPDLPDLDAPLLVDPAAVAFLDGWFGFATSVLEELRAVGARAGAAPSIVQLWPEHFDVAVEIGSAQADRRATYGASPGDATHPEPYLYVTAWSPVDRDEEFWNDVAFNGASLPVRVLAEARDQREAALDFFRQGFALLTS